ncbi:MAG TPA: dockerin type I domain-containing protein, partial [Humisphaera sp.]
VHQSGGPHGPAAPPVSAQRAAEPPRVAAASPSASNPARGDVDRNGVVNVLDAFAVARGVRDGRTDPAWDVNGDGVVDDRDAEQIARTAVTVRPNGGVQ